MDITDNPVRLSAGITLYLETSSIAELPGKLHARVRLGYCIRRLLTEDAAKRSVRIGIEGWRRVSLLGMQSGFWRADHCSLTAAK
ncbi:MAG: hypothetical protein JSV95_11520 [Gemmatimonadota bacterium]|nr:MAG: hypothetical protein JSV95_11520 [Gemmatimonadota bacterium]